ADLPQQGLTELQAVLEVRRGAHVQQGLLHLRVLAAQVDAADQVGLVCLLRDPARRAGSRKRKTRPT
ncbi:MAG: hypothetical protein ACKOBF_04910, partial [Limnohabitans sp.]